MRKKCEEIGGEETLGFAMPGFRAERQFSEPLVFAEDAWTLSNRFPYIDVLMYVLKKVGFGGFR